MNKLKSIIKLIIKCALVSAPIWLLSIYLAVNHIGYADPEIPNYWWNRQITNTKQDKYYSAIAIGDSSCNSAYMPEAISDSFLNLAQGGTSTVDAYYVLKEYLENNDAPTDVFFSFHESHLNYSEVYWEKIMPSHRFSLAENFEIISNAKRFDDETYGPGGAYADAIGYEFYFPSKYITSFINAKGNQRKEGNEEVLQIIERHGGRYTALGKAEFETSDTRDYKNYSAAPLYYYYLEQTIDLCEQNDIRLHFVKPPLPENSLLFEEYIESVFDFYDELLKGHNNVDFTWDVENRCYSNQEFCDEIHVNNDGAYRFSTFIKNEFPDAFWGTEPSADQMLAMDENILQENKPEYLWRFVEDRDYTVIMYDAYDLANEFMDTYYEDSDMTLSQVDDLGLSDENGAKTYYLRSPKSTASDVQIKDEEISYSISVNGAVGERWNFLDESGITFVVIDNVNNKLVTMKNLMYYGREGFSQYLS